MIYCAILGCADRVFIWKVAVPKIVNAVIWMGTCGASGVRHMLIKFAEVTAVFSSNHVILNYNHAALVIIATQNTTHVNTLPAVFISIHVMMNYYRAALVIIATQNITRVNTLTAPFRLHKVSELLICYDELGIPSEHTLQIHIHKWRIQNYTLGFILVFLLIFQSRVVLLNTITFSN